MEILTYIATLIKTIGDNVMIELVKSLWIKLAIALAIILLSSLPFVAEIIRALQGR